MKEHPGAELSLSQSVYALERRISPRNDILQIVITKLTLKLLVLTRSCTKRRYEATEPGSSPGLTFVSDRLGYGQDVIHRGRFPTVQ